MKTRGAFSFPMLVVVAAVALVIGTFGSAVAGPAITKHKVKSIAAKVVKKAAPTLSVAHATGADTLGGLPPSSYLNTYYTVGLAQATPVATFTKNLPAVPNGTYLVSMNISATLSGTNTFTCTLKTGTTYLMAAPAPLDQAIYAGINASRVITVTGPMAVNCGAVGGTFTSPIAFGYAPDAITFTRLDAGASLGTATRTTTNPGRPNGPAS